MVSFERLMNIVKAHSGMNHVTITGGEPMLQKNAVEFMNRLIKENVDVQIETNGSISLKEVPSGVRKISDVKTPSSGECGSFLMDNICFLGRGDEIKFVISDRADYDFSVDFLKSNLLNSITTINLSPANGFLKPDILAGWILSDKINIRLNLQLHRYIWADDFDGLKIEI
jgi:7-carboxy-7-deazaguanine synthase